MNKKSTENKIQELLLDPTTVIARNCNLHYFAGNNTFVFSYTHYISPDEGKLYYVELNGDTSDLLADLKKRTTN